MLHLLRFDPDGFSAARWFAAEKLDSTGNEDGLYRWHALLTAVFGKTLAPRPFHVLRRRGRPLQLLAYTREPPGALEAQARDFADPLAVSALGLTGHDFAAKPMPEFAEGRRLGFFVLARPTIRTDVGDDRTRTAEIDAYVAAAREAERQGRPRPPRAEVYREWILGRVEAGGARVCELRLDGLDQVPALRRDAQRRLRPVQGHAASVTGTLEVTDRRGFAEMLGRGVGRHRAFGYGMVLLSPP